MSEIVLSYEYRKTVIYSRKKNVYSSTRFWLHIATWKKIEAEKIEKKRGILYCAMTTKYKFA